MSDHEDFSVLKAADFLTKMIAVLFRIHLKLFHQPFLTTNILKKFLGFLPVFRYPSHGDSSFLPLSRVFPTWIIHTRAVLFNFQLKIGYLRNAAQASSRVVRGLTPLLQTPDFPASRNVRNGCGDSRRRLP